MTNVMMVMRNKVIAVIQKAAVSDPTIYENDFLLRIRTVSLQRLSRYPRKSRGLFAIRHSKSGPEGILRRQSASGRSVQSHPVACSSSSSDKSASLRIVWEGQHNWDDEFATTGFFFKYRKINSLYKENITSARIQPKALLEVLSLSSGVDQPDEGLCDNAVESDDAVYIDTVRRKCMVDSKYMYQSVILARLWELAQETPSTSRLKPERCEMTDSGLSRSTQSKHSQEHRSLFDSAIGGEVSSSEDESNGKLDRHVLNPLRESDSASQVSLEWCDDGFSRLLSVPYIDRKILEI
uniref:E3 ubiquitin-protein ligase HECW2 n=1 Tax=Angiostrongylus cantonensis TaxID=6313 RepID=A0A158P9J7_ANGCA